MAKQDIESVYETPLFVGQGTPCPQGFDLLNST